MDSCPCRGLAFFGMLIIGILAGYIAEKVTTSDQGKTSSDFAIAVGPALRRGWL